MFNHNLQQQKHVRVRLFQFVHTHKHKRLREEKTIICLSSQFCQFKERIKQNKK